MSEKTPSEIWAETAPTEPIPIWDVENGRFIFEMDADKPETVSELTIRERLIARALRGFNQ